MAPRYFNVYMYDLPSMISRKFIIYLNNFPLNFNIYMYDFPSMISRKFVYADDLALLHSSGNWKDLEGTLS